jgi:hypothetical protein
MKLELVTFVRSACIAGATQIHPHAHAQNNKSRQQKGLGNHL